MNDFEFEDELGRQIGKLDAPKGFSSRVMEQVAWRRARQQRRVKTWRLAIAASLLVCFGGGLGGYQVHERHEAEEARAQFAVAMRVTNRSLLAVNRGLSRIDRTNDGNGDTR